MKLLLGTIVSLVLTSTINAACNTGSCTGLVTKIYMTASGTLYIGTDGTETNLDCTAPGNQYVSLSPTDPGANSMYALLLTAKTTGEPVSIRIVDKSPTCQIAYVTAN